MSLTKRIRDRWLRWRLRKAQIVYHGPPTVERLPDKDGMARFKVNQNVSLEGKIPPSIAKDAREELQRLHDAQAGAAAEAFKKSLKKGKDE